MPHLKLLDKGARKSHRIESTEALVGRDPAVAVFLEGDAAKTVSGRHARFFLDDGKWYVEDAGSRNGTFIGSRKLEGGARHALSAGDVIGLGLTGTQLVVEEAVGRQFAATMVESAVPAPRPTQGAVRQPEEIRPDIAERGQESAGEVRVTLRTVQTGARIVGQADRVTIGRALDCLIRVEGESATSVSRVHTEIVALNGGATVRDGGSRHGTIVNGKKIKEPQPLAKGDVIMLGPGGPSFSVEDAIVVPSGTVAPAGSAVVLTGESRAAASVPSRNLASPKENPARGAKGAAEVFAESPTPALAIAAVKSVPKAIAGPAVKLARASLGGVARAALLRNAADGASQPGARRTRVFVWSAVAIFGLAIIAVVIYARQRPNRADAQPVVASVGFQQQATALDSLRAAATAETATTRASLDSAIRAAAPATVLDSLRSALAELDRRSSSIEESIRRRRKQ